MFLFFKPPQSYLQVQLLDPDGPAKRKAVDLEEAYAIKILQERQAKQKAKRKEASFKAKIKKQLEEGKTAVEVAAELTQEIIAEEPKFEFTEEMRADVARIMAEYERQVRLETQAMVIEFANQLAQTTALLEAELQRRIEEKRRRRIKRNRIKALILFASMDDNDE
jgi:hypothetical protein